MKEIFILLLVLLVFGCSTDLKVEIESDTAWHGQLDGFRKIGNWGNDSFDIPEDKTTVVLVQKSLTKDSTGYLRASIIEESLFSSDIIKTGYTTEVHGVIMLDYIITDNQGVIK